MVNDYISLDGKRYKVVADGWSPLVSRFRMDTVGLTGKTIIVDLTHSSRKEQAWQYRLRVFVNDPLSVDYGTHAEELGHYRLAHAACNEAQADGAIIPSKRTIVLVIICCCNFVSISLKNIRHFSKTCHKFCVKKKEPIVGNDRLFRFLFVDQPLDFFPHQRTRSKKLMNPNLIAGWSSVASNINVAL